MFEVEAKVRITKNEYDSLFKRLKREGEYQGESKKQDIYYERLNKGVVRLRQEGGQSAFDLKLLRTIQGIESNLEMEWKLNNSIGWQRFMKKLNFSPFMRKVKKTTIFRFRGCRVELCYVDSLGYYLEIERLLEKETEVTDAKKELIHCFQQLGYSKKDFEPRRYLELLTNTKKHV